MGLYISVLELLLWVKRAVFVQSRVPLGDAEAEKEIPSGWSFEGSQGAASLKTLLPPPVPSLTFWWEI